MAAQNEIVRQLLETLLRQPRVSRAEFIRASGLRPASVLKAVDVLKARGLVEEPGRSGARTGRTSPPLRLAGAFGAFLGVEVAPGAIRHAAVDAAGRTLDSGSIALPAEAAAGEILAVLKEFLKERRGRFKAVGFADPGLVDASGVTAIRAVGIPEWCELPLGPWLAEAAGAELALALPECGARAFLEYSRMPAEKQPGGIFLLHLDRGVGGAYLSNGELFRGDSCRAMEIGHLVVKPDGPLCTCGSRGCLEALAGEAGIVRSLRELLANGVRTSLSEECLSLEEFLRAVRSGDRAAELLARSLCREVAAIFPMVVTLLNPGRIAVTGRLAGVGAMLEEAVRDLLTERCMPGMVANLELTFEPGEAADAASGAAWWIRRRYLQQLYPGEAS